jgi:hypothetical protein
MPANFPTLKLHTVPPAGAGARTFVAAQRSANGSCWLSLHGTRKRNRTRHFGGTVLQLSHLTAARRKRQTTPCAC